MSPFLRSGRASTLVHAVLACAISLENGPTVEPLSPENMLCFFNGPLTGTEANMSGRMAIVTKSPLTGTVTDSHHGGWSAARLRWAGFDGLVFTGKADHPVYLYVEDGRADCATRRTCGVRAYTPRSNSSNSGMAKKT